MTAIDEYNTALRTAFARMLRAESSLSEAKEIMQKLVASLQMEVSRSETDLADAMLTLDKIMKEAGVPEEIVPGSGGIDYKLYYTTPRGSVKIDDVNAVPPEFVKTETVKSPMKKEIAAHLKALAKQGKPTPNWATIETSQGKLAWEAVKK